MHTIIYDVTMPRLIQGSSWNLVECILDLIARKMNVANNLQMEYFHNILGKYTSTVEGETIIINVRFDDDNCIGRTMQFVLVLMCSVSCMCCDRGWGL